MENIKRKKVTLKTISQQLGVSPATISKALRDSTDISDAMKIKVRRLTDELGYHPNLLARSLVKRQSNIIGVISQRLIRLLCPHCKVEKSPNEIESKLLNIQIDSTKYKIYDANGCSRCENTGYKGRVAIIEALRINGELDEQIAKRATLGQLKATAKKTGYITLADDAVRCVLEGKTSLNEVSRVIDLTQRLA